jgi:hypothetical protein
MRCEAAYISVILPAMTTDGTAEANPEMNRPMITPATDGTTPVRRQPILKAAQEYRYGFRRPNASEKGGIRSPPIACPIWYLSSTSAVIHQYAGWAVMCT